MPTSIRIAPPYSLLFISDQDGGKTPEITRGGPRIWSTASCIAVGCLAFMDGETEVTLGVATDVDPGVQPTFDGLLETPRQALLFRPSNIRISCRRSFLPRERV
jgi:hypothetical protein